MSDAIAYCDQCSKLIPPSDLKSGHAVALPIRTLCAECVRALQPDQREALERARDGDAEKPQRPASRRGVHPGPAPARGSGSVIIAVGSFAGVLCGVAIALALLGTEEDAPSPDAALGSLGVAAPLVVAEQPMDGARRLAEIRALIDAELSAYGEARGRLEAFRLEFADGPETEDARDLLEDLDLRYARRAEAAFASAVDAARVAASDDQRAAAISMIRAVGAQHAEGPWLQTVGRAKIAAAVDRFERGRAPQDQATGAAAAIPVDMADVAPGIILVSGRPRPDLQSTRGEGGLIAVRYEADFQKLRGVPAGDALTADVAFSDHGEPGLAHMDGMWGGSVLYRFDAPLGIRRIAASAVFGNHVHGREQTYTVDISTDGHVYRAIGSARRGAGGAHAVSGETDLPEGMRSIWVRFALPERNPGIVIKSVTVRIVTAATTATAADTPATAPATTSLAAISVPADPAEASATKEVAPPAGQEGVVIVSGRARTDLPTEQLEGGGMIVRYDADFQKLRGVPEGDSLSTDLNYTDNTNPQQAHLNGVWCGELVYRFDDPLGIVRVTASATFGNHVHSHVQTYTVDISTDGLTYRTVGSVQGGGGAAHVASGDADLPKGTHSVWVRLKPPERNSGIVIKRVAIELITAGATGSLLAKMAPSSAERTALMLESSAHVAEDGFGLDLAILIRLYGRFDGAKVTPRRIATVGGAFAASPRLAKALSRELTRADGYAFTRNTGLARSGASLRSLGSSAARRLAREKPEFVMIVPDVKEALAKRAAVGVQRSVASIVESVFEAGAVPAVLTLPVTGETGDERADAKIAAFNEALRAAARTAGVPCIDAFAILNRNTLTRSKCLSARGGPTPAGYTEIARVTVALYGVLERWAMGRRNASAAAGPGHVPNGGFERVRPQTKFADGWMPGERSGRDGQRSVRVGRANPRSGQRCIVVKSLADGLEPGATTSLRLEHGTYRLSFWATTEPGKNARVFATAGEEQLPGRSVTDEWQECVATFEVGDEGASVRLGLWTSTRGVRVWFDDVRLTRDRSARP